MKVILAMTILMVSTNVLAFEKEDSISSLQAALFNSNKDYNVHKKVLLEEDNDRIGDWNTSRAVAFKIEASIEEESRTYLMNSDELERLDAEKADFADFQESKKELPVAQEVSMNN